MKNDKTMKGKTKAPTPKTAATAPAPKAPEATAVRQPNAKVTAPAAPVKPLPAPPAAKAPEAIPVRQPSAKAPEAVPVRQQNAAVKAIEAPVTPAVKSQPAPPAAPAVVAPVPARAVVASQTEPAAPGRREITSDLIALRAYNLWEQQGRPQGREMANWLLAESQLKQEIQSFTA